MSETSPRGGYKLLKVPVDQIASLTVGSPQMARVAAESSVCNCDAFWAGPFEVVADVSEDGQLRMRTACVIAVQEGPKP